MASPIIIPFDNNPALTNTVYDTYTCPSGKFARVRIELLAGFMLLNNKCIFSATLEDVVLQSAGSGSLPSSFTTVYTVPSNRWYSSISSQATFNDGSSGNTSLEIKVLKPDLSTRGIWTGTSVTGFGTSVVNSIIAMAGDVIQHRTTNAGINQIASRSITAKATASNTRIINEYWLKAGDVLSTAAANTATPFASVINVDEYNVIS